MPAKRAEIVCRIEIMIPVSCHVGPFSSLTHAPRRRRRDPVLRQPHILPNVLSLADRFRVSFPDAAPGGGGSAPAAPLRPIGLNRTTIPAIIGMVVIVAYMAGSFLVFPDNAPYIVAHGSSYLLDIVILLAMWDKLHLLSPAVFRWALALWVAVGTIQAFPFPESIKNALLVVLKPLIAGDRFTMGIYSGGGRGFDLLAPEPSIAAPTILYFALTAVFLHDRGMISNRSLSWSLAQVALLAALNRSGSLTILAGAALLGWTPMRFSAETRGIGCSPLCLLWAASPRFPRSWRSCRQIFVPSSRYGRSVGHSPPSAIFGSFS